MVNHFFLGLSQAKKIIHNFPLRKEKRAKMIHICSSIIILSSKARTIIVVCPLSIFFCFHQFRPENLLTLPSQRHKLKQSHKAPNHCQEKPNI